MKNLMKYAVPLLLALLIAACASTPETATEAVPEEKAEKAATVGKPEAEYGRASELKALIERYSLEDYAEAEYAAAESDYDQGVKAYGSDNAASKKSFDSAIEGYGKVIEKAFPAFTRTRRERTESYKKQADDLKAPVAMKTEYAAAKAKYDQAVKAEADGDYESAARLFEELEATFKDIYEKTKDKKEKAEEAIRSTEEELSKAEELSKEADAAASEEESE